MPKIKAKLRRLVVGLTGGIASGKTGALKEFGRSGAHVISTDEIAHELLASRTSVSGAPGAASSVSGRGPVSRSVAALFGEKILDGGSGRIDRGKLGEIVFRDKRKLRELEKIIHPAILKEMHRRIRRSRRPVTVVDVPLLFEKKLAGRFHLSLAVYASREQQIARLAKRDGMGRSEALRRIRLQWPLRKKVRMADVVVDNTGSKGRFKRRIREYYSAFELMACART